MSSFRCEFRNSYYLSLRRLMKAAVTCSVVYGNAITIADMIVM